MLYGHRNNLILPEIERDAMRNAGHFNATVMGFHTRAREAGSYY